MKLLFSLALMFGASAFADSIGVVRAVKGDVQLTNENGVAKALVFGDQIHEHDRIATDKSSTLLIDLQGGNKLQVFSGTRLSIQSYGNGSSGNRALINLFKGKVRSQTKQVFDGKKNRFQVITQGVSADVSGTADFFLSHDKSSHVTSRAEVLDGEIILNERMGDKQVALSRGELDTYVLNDAVLTKETEWSNSPENGFFNPSRKLSVAEFEELYKNDLSDAADRSKTLKIQKEVKHEPQPIICKSPNGQLNQCAWRCLNNSKGAKVCEADKANVSCVRLRCNANGVWAEETKLPATAATKCKAKGAVVDECDY